MQGVNRLNPIVCFVYFVCVIFLGMVFTHPIYLIVSIIFSLLATVLIDKKSLVQKIKFCIPAFFAISAINPLFNTLGDTVLFTYFNNRPYTLEALLFGVALALLFFTVINWFSCYSAVITSDKFMYIFGKIIPAISLMLSMVMKFIPVYKNKITAIANARKSVGKGFNADTQKEKITNGVVLISVLTSVALEDAITTSDSMKSRGYGLPDRSCYSIYNFSKKDVSFLAIELLLLIIIVICWVNGSAVVEFIPTIILAPFNVIFLIGIIAYAILLLLPSIFILWEEIKWNILKSKI